MNFLDRIKSTLQSEMVDSWKIITNTSQLDEAEAISYEKPVILFKHSVSCGISAAAKYRLEQNWSDLEADVEFYYLDLLAYRPISNEIASRYKVIHQSPQVIILKGGVAVYDNSHHMISIAALNTAIATL